MKVRTGWLLICFCLWFAGAALAGGAGTTGADVLKVNMGARPNAMAGAYSAVGNDVQVLLFNPASLSGLHGTDVIFQHVLAFEEVGYELLGYGQPVEDWGTVGAILLWRHMPSIDNPGAPDAPVEANDLVFTYGFGRSLNEWFDKPVPWFDGLSLGLAAKLIYLSLREAHATSLAADVGFCWSSQKRWSLPVRVALGVLNLGAPVRFIDVADPLPITGRLGISLEPWVAERHRTLVTAEAVITPDHALKSALGAEYTLASVLSFRLGYTFESQNDLSGPAAGLGVSFLVGTVRAHLDYAYRPTLWKGYDSISNNHYFSIGATF